VLHQLLTTLRLGRHFKGEFRLTKGGSDLAGAPARLFAELIPFFVLRSTTPPTPASKIARSANEMCG
jgi:hypothetical protein